MPESSLTGRLVAGRYRVIRLIARGGMASVYLAEDERLEREVALKVIHSHLAEDPSFRTKFIREAKIAAKLSHPNLINVFDQGEEGNLIFLAMEYVPGITLRDVLKKFNKLSPGRALELFEPMLAGLAAAHKAGILHRDIKPENVFLADDGRVKLGDFGLARSISANTQTGSLIGTVAYLSPELVTRGLADARSDVYAAGIVLYELLTGTQPFVGEQAVQVAYQHANDQVPAPSSVDPTIPELLDEIVLWSTARDPNHRPANAASLLAVISQAKLDLKNGTEKSVKKLAETRRLDELDAMRMPASERTEMLGDSDFEQLSTVESDSTERTAMSANATEALDGEGFEVDDDLEPLEVLWQTRKRRAVPIVIAMFLTVLLGLGGGWWFSSGPGALSAVPELSNRPLAQAMVALQPFNSNVLTQTEYSNTVAKGSVIKTDPPAGSLFFKGSTITLFVSKGAKLAKVPDLQGLTLAQARNALKRSGFKLGEVANFFSTNTVGLVFDYLGSDGTKLGEGTAISISVSAGPLPAVSGLDQASAINAIQAAGLTVSKVTQQFSETVAKGTVLNLSPDSEPLAKGGSVTLVVSKGTSVVIMPAVVGETLAAAQKLLQDLGLNVLVNTDQLKANWGLVKVKTASAAAGTKLRAGDSVTISNLK